MNIRKDIRNYTSDELNKLRIAMKTFQEKIGEFSYIDMAGYHGIPKALCPHGSFLFLPWHRYYIFKFESELKKIDSSVNLPYWDWTSMESLQTGIPDGYNDQFYNLQSGVTEENSLYNGPIEDRSRKTKRFPGRVEQLKSISDSAKLAYKNNTYESFNSAIEGPHGSIHVWVGAGGANRGEMSSVPRAAFDPIFWAHHTNIDRQWAVWQSPTYYNQHCSP